MQNNGRVDRAIRAIGPAQRALRSGADAAHRKCQIHPLGARSIREAVMSNNLERRLERLEGPPPGTRTIIAAPDRCKTTEEWLEGLEDRLAGRGHYVLGPVPVWPGTVRRMIWVPAETAD